MKKQIFQLTVILLFSLFSMTQLNAKPIEPKYPDLPILSVEELQEDYKAIEDFVRSSHPKLNRFTEKEELDRLFKEGYDAINRPMNVIELYKLIQPTIAKIGCGHSSSWIPNYIWRRFDGGFLPIAVANIDDKFYIKSDFSSSPSPLPGSELISINGIAIQDISESLKQFISTDAFIENAYRFKMEKKFPYLHMVEYGLFEEYDIEYQGLGLNEIKTTTLKSIPRNSLKSYNSYGNSLDFKILKGNQTAILTIETFGFYDEVNYFKDFIDDSFEELNKKKIKNLIIDLRGNSGGDPWCSSHLLTCIIDKPVRYFGKLFFGYQSLFTQKLKPAKKRFNGNAYVLIDGNGFSTTGHLTALIKENEIATLVGSTTGGTFTCNDASSEITAQNSGLLVRIARRTYYVSTKNVPYSEGIKPDLPIERNIDDLISGRDTEVEYLLEYLKTP